VLLPPSFLDCVVAIGIRQETGQKAWIASGFLIGELVESVDEKRKLYSTYLATNRHVFEGQKEAWVRFNPRDTQPAREYLLGLEDRDGKRIWQPHSDPTIDVAVVPINVGILRQEGMQFDYFRSDEHVADRKRLVDLGLGEGDFVYVLGFPMGLIGGERNFVIVRQGVIARIRDALVGAGNEYVLDAFIFPGNSGGPVVTKPELISIIGTKVISSSILIGMVKAYVPYRDVAISTQTGQPRVIFEENSGLAAIIPIDFVREPIQRHMESEKKRKQGNITPS